MGLGRPEVYHRSDHVKRVPDAEDDFVDCKGNLPTERVVGLEEPALIVDLALPTEAAVLQHVMQGVV